MKISGNDKRTDGYYIGLDVGTESVGWAAASRSYDLLRHRGNAMWGVRLFDEASGAAERRSYRTARRRAARRRQRLDLLELIFSEEIGRVDPMFFARLKESALHRDDKPDARSKYSIFDDDGFTDADYHKKYPTVYHLRSELIHSAESHDVRLVFLALHHIIKSRGHFLFDMDAGDGYKDIRVILGELRDLLMSDYDIDIEFGDGYIGAIMDDIGVTAKARAVRKELGATDAEQSIDLAVMSDALAGKTVKLAALFKDPALGEKDVAERSLCLRGDMEEKYDSYAAELGDRIELVTAMKAVYDSARLAQILGRDAYISDAKVRQWETNRADLARLKSYVREYESERYEDIFVRKGEKLDNYAAYSGYTCGSGEHVCKQENFCKYLKKELASMKEHPEYSELWLKTENGELLPRLRGADNSVIPMQLHLAELKKILENASGYLGFLSAADDEGRTVSDKIIRLFDFRIPYYVGPLNPRSPRAWVVRSDEKITPWNFDQVVDTKACADEFMIRLTGKCTYTGDDVLPRDSLLYSEYAVLNEINPLSVNGHPLPTDTKLRLYKALFVDSNSKVTKRSIKEWLLGQCLIKAEDDISGVDDTIKSKLKSYHDFKKLLDRTHDTETVEEIIRHILIFGDDKRLLRDWLRENCTALDAKDIDYISRLKYKDWGRLSKTFLTGLYTPGEGGEALSVMDMLRSTNNNLMQLMSDKYSFSEAAEEYRSKYGTDETLEQRLDALYIPPAVKRSIRQTLRVVDEITDVRRAAPEKIFIEVARDAGDAQKGKRTVSRKERLIALYKACKEDSGALYEALEAESEGRLRHDALYLYYTQFGKCMYSGEEISLTEIDKAYDVDHIYPRSKIKDDSLDNRVLVSKRLNLGKTDVYPISAEIRSRMRPFWLVLKKKGMISDKKFERLVRSTPLSEDELSAFVNRQLVETRQSTKALASILAERYPNTRIVYSKAENVSEFRQKFDIVKCRDVNDLHHAKDAYLNIVVGNVYCTKFTDAFFKNISREKYSLKKIFDYDVPGAWNASTDIGRVKNIVFKNNVLVTRMSYEVKGGIAKRQISPRGKGQLPVKEGMDIAVYGGYDKIAGTYFFVAEHTSRKKRIRTVEPVYIYKKALYEADPIRYCTEILGLVDPVIVCRRILKDSMLELDGKRFYITGRTGDRLLGKHPYQLAVGYGAEQSIKKISKYIERCDAAKCELEITIYDGITAEGNLELYDMLTDKLRTPVYGGYFSGICKTCDAGRDTFVSLSLNKQCRLLLELLRLFKCDRSTADLTLIGGAKTSGVICPLKTVSNCSSAHLINQSVTGLFETRVDLLS